MKVVREKMAAKGRPLPAAQGAAFTGDCSSCSMAATCGGKALYDRINCTDNKVEKTESKKEEDEQ